jgi:hypothetical protein
MKVSIQSIFKWLLVLAIFIFAAAILTAPSREGLENESTSDIMLTKPNSGDVKNALMERFKYFKMLPEDNKWSQETLDAFKVKLKETQPNISLTDEYLKTLQKFGSEEEAKIFIETGIWPMNEFTKTNIKKGVYSDPNIKEEEREKTYDMIMSGKHPFFSQPNSSLLFNPFTVAMTNGVSTESDIKGQVKFIQKRMQGITLDDNTKFTCAGKTGVSDLNTVPKFNDQEVADYKELEKIPGLKFLQSPCNPCSNRCPYSYEDVTLPAYAVYWGISAKTGKAGASEVGAPNMEEGKLKTCLIKANKKIIDMGGEPEACD